MGMTRRDVCASGLAASAIAGRSSAQKFSSATRAELQKALSDRVAAIGGAGNGVGLAATTEDLGRRETFTAGRFAVPNQLTAPGAVVCEIASVTKAFTGLLLCDMSVRGEVSLTDPVARHLPGYVRLPTRGEQVIRLVDLATHTSGLPFMPERPLAPTRDAWLAYPSTVPLTHDIGSHWDYSNLGYWLLGEALAVRASVPLEQLMQARVLRPLGLRSTGFSLTPSMRSRLATGHDAGLAIAPRMSQIPGYELIAMSGAAGLYSTADDLARFVAAAMGKGPPALTRAFAAMLETRRPTGSRGEQQALGWTIFGEGDDEVVFRDGGSFGFASAVAFDPKATLGIALLQNQVTGVDDVARHALRSSFPLEAPKIERHAEIVVPLPVLAGYAGRYASPTAGSFKLELEAGHLVFQAPGDWGLPALRLHAETTTAFFATELPLRIEVETGEDGRGSGLLIHPPRGQAPIIVRRSLDDG